MKRYIPVHSLFDNISEGQHNILLSVYCLTGCDTSSFFFGKWKKTVFKLYAQRYEEFQSLYNLGEEAVAISEVHTKACTSFIATLYGHPFATLNQIRCMKAQMSVQLRNTSIPPTENSFHQHCLRCVLQLWIWRHEVTPMHDVHVPTQFGYEYNAEANCLQPVLMTQPVAAPELLNDIVCMCELCDDECVCFVNKQSCSIACACKSRSDGIDRQLCTNMYSLALADDENDYDN